jgi:hypothetical protein
MFKFITLIVAILSSLASSAQADDSNDPRHYTNQLPYGNAATSQIKAPPAGYQVFFLETLGRHGSRTLTDSGQETRALSVWTAASKKGALTTRGQHFDNDVKAFRTVEQSIGYGELSDTGKDEWSGIGRRTAVNYAPFFAKTVADGDKVAFRTTSIHRTIQSASAMRASLTAANPDLTYADRVTDNTRMLFANGASKNGNAAIATALKASNVRAAAHDVLHRIYSTSYVNSLSDPVSKALDIYRLYNTAPGLAGQTSVTFADYVPLADAKVLGYAEDVQNFYRYGPGVTGETTSYRAARPLLADFFSRLDSRIAGGKTAAVFRLAHGETTMPFEALIKAPGSTTQVKKGSVYKYGSNSWRGSVAGRLAGSVEWAAYRNSTGHILVTMRLNEVPVKFNSSCKASAAGAYFYRVSTLKNCLG